MFIAAVVFLILTVICTVTWLCIRPARYSNESHYGMSSREVATLTKKSFGVSSLVFATVALIGLVFSSIATVSTKNEGIVTAFGKPTGHLSNGLHLKAPWEKVTQMDAAIQPENFTDPESAPRNDPNRCVDVRIGNQSIACVETRMQWRIDPTEAETLFRDYRSFDHLRSSLVLPQLRSSLNNAFQDYNPISLLVSGAPVKDILNQKGAEVQRVVQQEVGDRIKIVNVTLPLIQYDDATQSNINAYQVQVAKTRIAEQAKQTAIQQAAANDTLSKSLQQTGIDVLISKCLDLVGEGKTVPGWCFPPGGSSNILVNPGVTK